MPFNVALRHSARVFCLLLVACPARFFASTVPKDGPTLLREADRLADLYNWADAAPLYADAEKFLSAAGDSRGALVARLGRMRGSMETYSLPALSDEFAALLKLTPVQNDPELKLRCLMAKGDVDGEINARLATSEWNQVLEIAHAKNDRRLESRCNGELAILAFIQGQVQDASRNVRTSFRQATLSASSSVQRRMSCNFAFASAPDW